MTPISRTAIAFSEAQTLKTDQKKYLPKKA
ncbi:MAG: hypothetical protein ACI8RD_010476 [Bacillariaceae sp.]|jgi:hypothetical protein